MIELKKIAGGHKMTRIEFIGWCIVIIGIVMNTILNVIREKHTWQNQQILVDEIEALRLELKERDKK